MSILGLNFFKITTSHSLNVHLNPFRAFKSFQKASFSQQQSQGSKIEAVVLPVESYVIPRYIKASRKLRMHSSKETMNNRALHHRTKWMNFYARNAKRMSRKIIKMSPAGRALWSQLVPLRQVDMKMLSRLFGEKLK